MTNCPNCGAPIKIHGQSCEYCGTYFNHNDFNSNDFTFDYEVKEDDIIRVVYRVYDDRNVIISKIFTKVIHRSEMSSIKPDPIYRFNELGELEIFKPPCIYDVEFIDLKGNIILKRDKIMYELKER